MARNPSLFSPGSLTGAADPFFTLHREVNRLFDDVIRGGGTPGGGGSGPASLIAPHTDVSETDKEIRIQAELPGVSENDLELSLDDDLLTIRAEKKQQRKEEREGVHISERSFGTFQRSIRLPFRANPDQVQARFENGVLHVTVPKAQPQERTRRIQIQAGSGGGKTLEGSASSAPSPSPSPGAEAGKAP